MTQAEIEMAARIREQIFKTYPMAKRQAMTDIVERLRRYRMGLTVNVNRDLMEEAADEIERLRALTAAAEVVTPDKTVWVSTECMNSERAATIERCAQVAENFRSTNHPYHASPEDQIAAAIRSLKD